MFGFCFPEPDRLRVGLGVGWWVGGWVGWGATDIGKCIQLYGLLILSLTVDESRSLHFLLIAISFINHFVKVLNLACDYLNMFIQFSEALERP